MKRPKNYAYWLDEAPPLGITLLSGLQHIGLVCSFLPIPLAVAREAGLADARVVYVISVSMLVLGVTTILQVLRRGPVGSGLLAPSCFSGAYLGPSLLAVKAGGLPLVLGMTMFGGIVEIGLSRVLRKFVFTSSLYMRVVSGSDSKMSTAFVCPSVMLAS